MKWEKRFWFAYWVQTFNDRTCHWAVGSFPAMTDVMWSISGFPNGCFICESREQAEAFAEKCNKAYKEHMFNSDKYSECQCEIVTEFRQPLDEWWQAYALEKNVLEE